MNLEFAALTPGLFGSIGQDSHGALANRNHLAGRFVDRGLVVFKVWYRTAKANRAHVMCSREHYPPAMASGEVSNICRANGGKYDGYG